MLDAKVILNRGNGEIAELSLNVQTLNGIDVKEVTFKKLDLGILYSFESVDFNTDNQFIRLVINADLVVSIENL